MTRIRKSNFNTINIYLFIFIACLLFVLFAFRTGSSLKREGSIIVNLLYNTVWKVLLFSSFGFHFGYFGFQFGCQLVSLFSISIFIYHFSFSGGERVQSESSPYPKQNWFSTLLKTHKSQESNPCSCA